jgi:hypothetical protein
MIIWCPVFLSCPRRQQIDEEAVAPGCQFGDAAPGRFGGNARGKTLFQLGSQRRIAQGHVPPCHSMRSSLSPLPSVPVASEPVYITEGELRGDRRGSQKNLAGYRWFESISLQRRVCDRRGLVSPPAMRSRSRAAAQWLIAGQHAASRLAHVEALSHLDRGLTLLLSLPASDARDAREIELQLALGLCSITVKGMSASVAPIP